MESELFQNWAKNTFSPDLEFCVKVIFNRIVLIFQSGMGTDKDDVIKFPFVVSCG